MKAIIQLQYRKLFDKDSQKIWDKYIFNDTHLEYRMKCQEYTQMPEKLTFKELLKENPKAEKLHYLVSLACLNHLQWLQDIMPDVVNTIGERCLPFEGFKFQILQSSFNDKTKHKVQIDFFSKPLYWLETINNKMLLSVEKPSKDSSTETFMIDLQANLSITNYMQLC